MAPEIKLIFQLAASGMMVHLTNSMFSSSIPTSDDIFRQNPELMKEINKAAINSMRDTKPGFTGFMNDVVPQTKSGGGPPPAINTQDLPNPRTTQSMFPDTQMTSRPDLDAARNNSTVNSNFSMLDDASDRIIQQNTPKQGRPEMKGPGDITGLLSGLKSKKTSKTFGQPQITTKPVNTPPMRSTKEVTIPKIDDVKINDDTGSTVSISELKELQMEGKTPRRTKNRSRNNSDKNIVSLDI